jgi:hypothetical protein
MCPILHWSPNASISCLCICTCSVRLCIGGDIFSTVWYFRITNTFSSFKMMLCHTSIYTSQGSLCKVIDIVLEKLDYYHVHNLQNHNWLYFIFILNYVINEKITWKSFDKEYTKKRFLVKPFYTIERFISKSFFISSFIIQWNKSLWNSFKNGILHPYLHLLPEKIWNM